MTDTHGQRIKVVVVVVIVIRIVVVVILIMLIVVRNLNFSQLLVFHGHWSL